MPQFLTERNPFEGGNDLKNISTEEVAGNMVIVDQSKSVGESILKKITGENVYTCSFKRKDVSVTMASKVSVKVGGKDIQIDPNLLFQRLATLSNVEDDKKYVFSFELCSFPASLFQSQSLPRLANKAALADHLWTLLTELNDQESVFELNEDHLKFVVDGGALLHKIPWPKNKSYTDLCLLYSHYLKNKYGNPTVVFDGYETGPTIKDAAHIRRNSNVSKQFSSNQII